MPAHLVAPVLVFALETLRRDKPGKQVVLSVRTDRAAPRNVEVLATSGGAECHVHPWQPRPEHEVERRATA